MRLRPRLLLLLFGGSGTRCAGQRAGENGGQGVSRQPAGRSCIARHPVPFVSLLFLPLLFFVVGVVLLCSGNLPPLEAYQVGGAHDAMRNEKTLNAELSRWADRLSRLHTPLEMKNVPPSLFDVTEFVELRVAVDGV
ncbi:hypothetical protein TraAM80_08545 [Trypanosoma rangeli]|uniref:Uncharacterized protein n=1 Tax=Trypanosoma rangeli TaxID=5698 RepID=A0A3R7KEK0_TRYRA|nr:uncharacterized protein TraAM80_08545 [Trypanosoma rangeli]RNE98906.1 hypothetical protein TraAM80_08545 [Trypanosoma rangeli]|eukprot:RNE98906.1 hypothetical protein TraAM80_08545 [Trypanosoma rangeli]